MEIIVKILYSIFFLVLNYFLYTWSYKGLRIRYKYLYFLGLSAIFLFLLNVFFEKSLFNIFNKLFLVLLLFSSSIIIFKYLRKFVDLSNRHNLLKENPQLKEKYNRFTNFIFSDLYTILLIIYELLLIWSPLILNDLLEG
jgi:multidrug transporter EmrE-like cation transporter